jgi:hypothetical protein
MNRRNTPKGWVTDDVGWICPGRKKPIAYSTIATRDWINEIMEDGMTILELRRRLNDFIRDEEAEKVLDEYIKRGFGDWICKGHWFVKEG